MKHLFILVLLLLSTSLLKAQSLYFPPLSGNQWETINPAELGWCQDSIEALYTMLDQANTKSFIVLKDGKIVLEKYFDTFTADSFWYWASAGKTLTAFTIGLAQEQNIINVQAPVSQYLGTGWTSAPSDKELQIKVWNQLTMTSGLDDSYTNNDCTEPQCLQYLADAGTRWAYHNAPYTLLHAVVDSTGTTFNNFYLTQLRNKIGMNGLWIPIESYNKVYFSNTRSMARFGLLLLNRGVWNNDTILHDTDYFDAMTNTSQDLNLSYGYLTWLNGKSSYMLPLSQTVISGAAIPDAPDDMIMALGKNDQKLHVVPSQGLVVVRLGEAASPLQLVPIILDNQIWEKLSAMSCPSSTIASVNTEEELIQTVSDRYIQLNPALINKSFTVFNIVGQLVLEGMYTQPIHIQHLTPGQYIINCNNQSAFFIK
jgi:CubicO group peptidase (beta-lactamase class C family)